MTYCVVKDCHNSTQYPREDVKITFHNIPADPCAAAAWIDKIRLSRKDKYWMPTKSSKICSEHFKDEDKYTTFRGLYRIRQGAIPTKNLHIFCTESEHSNLDTNDEQNDALNLSEPRQDSSNASGVHVYICSPSTSQQNETINSNESEMPTDPISKSDDSDLDSIYDTPRESKLRKQLKQKTLRQRKYVKKIRDLQQKNRRITKKYIFMQKIFVNLIKKQYIDSGNTNVLSENEFAVKLYNKLVKKI